VSFKENFEKTAIIGALLGMGASSLAKKAIGGIGGKLASGAIKMTADGLGAAASGIKPMANKAGTAAGSLMG
jgi:hypothetical protein